MQLCRDVYHCTPSELGEQDYSTVRLHLEILAAEAQVRAAQMGKRAGTRKAPARRSA